MFRCQAEVTAIEMDRFPQNVAIAMKSSGAMTTCVPVKMDDGAWESMVFFQLVGAECKADRLILRRVKKSIAVGLETDLIAHKSAAIVVLRFEVFTDANNPMIGEVLLATGQGGIHFETLQCLTHQNRLVWNFADEAFDVIHRQQHPLLPHQHNGFDDILRDAVSHDALIRATGKYDAGSALSDIVGHYELRQDNKRSGYQVNGRRNLHRS